MSASPGFGDAKIFEAGSIIIECSCFYFQKLPFLTKNANVPNIIKMCSKFNQLGRVFLQLFT
ncbi:hypothetical protein A6J40_05640 [Legionella longbeachae]|nr:hypothetical protein A6J40_05640 [Legionella longbeachae]